MPKFTVRLRKEYIEVLDVEVEAANAADAEILAEGMNHDDVEWDCVEDQVFAESVTLAPEVKDA